MAVVSGIELAAIATTLASTAGSWEPMWIIGVQAVYYFLHSVQPGAGNMYLVNGAVIPWLRYLTWLLTCPVLLMFLVTMTTYGGRSAAVKLVPLLVLSQLMVLMVITAQSNEDVLVIKWLLVFVAATCFGMIISFSVNCLQTLHGLMHTFQGTCGVHLMVGVTLSFLVGWVLYPIGYALGVGGLKVVGSDAEEAIFMVADLLSRNIFLGLAVRMKHAYLRHVLSASSFKSTSGEGGPERRLSLTDIILNERGGTRGGSRLPQEVSVLALSERRSSTEPPPDKVPSADRWNEFDDHSVSWTALHNKLLHPDASSFVSDGAASHHRRNPRHEAALQLVSNHVRVLRDITRADGPPASQPELTRLPDHKARHVELAMLEVARRLIGRFPAETKQPARPATPQEAITWAATADFLSTRLQSAEQEVTDCFPPHDQRKPDMSPAAAKAMRAVLSEVAQEQDSRWGKLHDRLRHAGAKNSVAVGAAADHECAARHEAALKLVTNHGRVLRDLTRDDGPPPTQLDLDRLHGQQDDVEPFIHEVARRLIGQLPGESLARPGYPKNEQQAVAWTAAADYLSGRLQTTAAQVADTEGHEGRKPDMSPKAGAAMLAVLAEVAVAREQDGRWGKLHDRLRHAGAKNSVAVGAAADHECAARHEAALKLVTNHGRVLRDLTRDDGPPPTQLDLDRLHGQQDDVEPFIREVARRLTGRLSGERLARHVHPTSSRQSAARQQVQTVSCWRLA